MNSSERQTFIWAERRKTILMPIEEFQVRILQLKEDTGLTWSKMAEIGGVSSLDKLRGPANDKRLRSVNRCFAETFFKNFAENYDPLAVYEDEEDLYEKRSAAQARARMSRGFIKIEDFRRLAKAIKWDRVQTWEEVADVAKIRYPYLKRLLFLHKKKFVAGDIVQRFVENTFDTTVPENICPLWWGEQILKTKGQVAS